MDKEWILAFAFFMLFNNSPEIMKLLETDDFDGSFKDYVKQLENMDAERLKELVVEKSLISYDKMKAINEAYKYRKSS